MAIKKWRGVCMCFMNYEAKVYLLKVAFKDTTSESGGLSLSRQPVGKINRIPRETQIPCLIFI